MNRDTLVSMAVSQHILNKKIKVWVYTYGNIPMQVRSDVCRLSYMLELQQKLLSNGMKVSGISHQNQILRHKGGRFLALLHRMQMLG